MDNFSINCDSQILHISRLLKQVTVTTVKILYQEEELQNTIFGYCVWPSAPFFLLRLHVLSVCVCGQPYKGVSSLSPAVAWAQRLWLYKHFSISPQYFVLSVALLVTAIWLN